MEVEKPTEAVLELQLAERTARVLARPNLLEEIFAHCANGGTVITMCETWNVRYSDIAAWLHADRDREQRYLRGMTAREEWAQERILQEIRAIGLVDLREAYTEGGFLKEMKDMPAHIARAIVGVETEELFEGHGKDRVKVGNTVKVKFIDKLKALELLGKNQGMFVQRHDHKVTTTLEDLVAASNTPPPKKDEPQNENNPDSV